MAHEILEHDNMISGRNITPWHELGEIIDEVGIPDLYRIMGWPVDLVRCKTVDGDLTDSYATVRLNQDGSRIVLSGGLSANYKVLQNNELIEIIKPFVEQGCALETAGTLKNGQRVWILLRLAKDLNVGKDDVIQRYIMVSNDHTGRQSARFGLVGIRVVCQNTLNIAEGSGRENKLIRVFHTGNIADNLRTVAAMLDHVNGQFKNYGINLEMLARVGVNGNDLKRYVEDCFFPNYSHKRKDEEADKIITTTDKVIQLFETGAGSDLAVAKGTVYGAYQAVNNYLNHNREVGLDKRLPSLLWGIHGTLDKRALHLAQKLAA